MLLLLLGAVGADRSPPAPPLDPLPTYPTPHYTIHTDLRPAEPEIALRLEAMYRAYTEHASEWGGRPGQPGPKPDVYLFRRAADYAAAGGPRGTSGIFLPGSDSDRGKALVLAGPTLTLASWQVLQHEAFHAYVHCSIDREGDAPLPPWVEEGLADYFGEGLFTGDRVEVGLIPPWRLARLRSEMRGGQLRPLAELLAVSRERWRGSAGVAGYDQAWSLVHFLLHGENGKDQPRLAEFVRTRSLAALGPIEQLQQQWQRYWLALPANPTADRFARVVAETLDAFRARAAAGGQSFDSFARFRAAGEAGQIRMPPTLWLPPTMLTEALDAADASGTWTLSPPRGRSAELAVMLPDRTTITASYTLSANGIPSTWTRISPP